MNSPSEAFVMVLAELKNLLTKKSKRHQRTGDADWIRTSYIPSVKGALYRLSYSV